MTWRFERKFLVESILTSKIEYFIQQHPACFSEIYKPRFINNIYFDTTDLTCFYENLVGSSDRYKVRIRWYGNLEGYIEKPVLELKIKSGQLGRKESFPLQPFQFKLSDTTKPLSFYLQGTQISEKKTEALVGFTPALVNRYHRSYYLTLNKKYRLTLDTKLHYYNPSFSSILCDYDETSKILELKYDQHDDNEASYYSSYFPFNVTKSSKYVMGIERVFQ